MVLFSCNADMSHLYVQKTIINKVRDLLKKRAQAAYLLDKLLVINDSYALFFNNLLHLRAL